ncbi:trans-sialidase [Trypanosoma cruzi Dm28c]|uniref:Trans-sialidase n=1 Tax=Trypanosoma cruzi Dm28c TaxID=1416333 RepID=V5CJF0_TRYCR|nr:trans-sialidase [Trypanosoma cruzi Dm28c]
MVYVCEGWCGVAGQCEGCGAAFPACRLFLPCVCAAFCFPPLTLFSCVPAWSGRLLTGHVDRECLLTASIHLPPPVCLSFPVVCGVLHRVRAGPHTPTARRDLPCCCSFLCAMVLRAVPYRLSFSRSLHRCSALLCSPLTFLVYCCCCCTPPLLEHSHARKERKHALIATEKIEGSERTNSTHTPPTHTYLYVLTCCCSHGTPHTQPSPCDRIQRKEEGRKRE